ncbi:MAG: MCP four helix bundle domain-containing protein [Burkholderiales bacterium]|nr:MCP four helix bundle domain-containing protein [Opitutaceae bacterium]
MKDSTTLVRRRVSLHAITYVILLSLSMLALGGVGIWFTASVSHSLEELRQETLPAASVMRVITREAGRMRRSVDELDLPKTPDDIAVIRARVEDFRKINNDNLKQLEVLLDEPQLAALLTNVVATRHLFLGELAELFRIVERGDAPELRLNQKLVMARAYERYRDEQDKLAEYCEIRASEQSEAILLRAGRFEVFGVITALWPLLAGAGLFLYGVVSTALVFFRSRNGD